MKQLFTGLIVTTLLFSIADAAPINKALESLNRFEAFNNADNSKLFLENSAISTQQNLIGDVTAIDINLGKITIKSQTSTSMLVTINDKTAFRRIPPGQTSLVNAEQITVADIKVGDRVLVPGGVVNEETPVRQIIVMAREAINAQRDQERENRRARTLNGRITAINPEKKEITIQSRGRAADAETITIAASGNVKFLRYAPDSLKISDAQSGSFNDLRVGDQIRTIGDRNADGSRVTAEEIVSGSITRNVGSIVEVNVARGEVIVKSGQTGQTMTVVIGKNTTIRRITPDVAETLKQRANQRADRRRERTNQQPTTSTTAQQPQGQQTERRNRRENRSVNGEGQQGQGNRGLQQPFENLPAVSIAELKKGDAVLITGMGTVDNLRMTAVSIVTGDGDLQSLLQRSQGGRNGSPNSPGLPGNVGGGNSGDDRDEPRN